MAVSSGPGVATLICKRVAFDNYRAPPLCSDCLPLQENLCMR
jgi:hypothetical protein